MIKMAFCQYCGTKHTFFKPRVRCISCGRRISPNIKTYKDFNNYYSETPKEKDECLNDIEIVPICEYLSAHLGRYEHCGKKDCTNCTLHPDNPKNADKMIKNKPFPEEFSG